MKCHFPLFPKLQNPDPTLLDLYVGLENGKMIDGSGGELPAGYDPRTRDWYKQTKAKNPCFTDAYIDALTQKLCYYSCYSFKKYSR